MDWVNTMYARHKRLSRHAAEVFLIEQKAWDYNILGKNNVDNKGNITNKEI